jgi:hypothetical protein
VGGSWRPISAGVRAVAALALVCLGATSASGQSWIDKAEDEGYTARHECSFVQAGDHFYLFGGRENAQTLDTYDFAADSWSTSASAPIPFNHFQAVEYQGLVWVIGAFKTNSFPNEAPADAVYVYDPARDVWMQGPDVPVSRRRGSTGLVVHQDKFYVVAGNTIGHNGGYVSWFDEFDPQTGAWTQLTNAPNARDHFHAAVAGGKLYAVGGRLSGGTGGTFAPLIGQVDVYDFAAETWSAAPNDLPTPRAATAVAVFDGKILVIGGEGNGQAYAKVDALDPATGDWEDLDSLHFARHGTQAIVSGQGVYVTAGSPNQGGGNQRNMEVYDTDSASGAPGVAGVLTAPDEVVVRTVAPASLTLAHVAGSQGAFVNSVALSGPDASDFAIATSVADPFLVLAGGSRELVVTYSGSVAGASAFLDVTYGGGETVQVALIGTNVVLPLAPWIGGLVPVLLLVLGRRAARTQKIRPRVGTSMFAMSITTTRLQIR